MNKDKFVITMTADKVKETTTVVGVHNIREAMSNLMALCPIWGLYEGGVDIHIENTKEEGK